MLTRLWSPAFHRNGEPRPVITMHAGVNIIEGADQAQNSIGKSTLLPIIDFIYAGNDFLNSDAVRLPQAVGHHAIHFTLRLNSTEHHFVRTTERPGFVTRYQDPNWQETVEDLTLAEYQQFLLDEYGLGETGGTWRELVGRFSRVDERDMALLDRPLAAAARANDIEGAKALLRLFGAYEEIDKIQSRYDQVRKEVDAINSRLTIVEATLSGQTRITTRDLEEFYEFFPHANRESLETIEYYHHQLTGILEDQLHEQQRHYQAQAAELQVAIHNLQAQILALGESVQLDDAVYDQSAQLQARIDRLEEQIRTFDHNEELKKERKQLKHEIAEAIPQTLGHLTDAINAQMKTVNDALYPQQHRKSPRFTFKAATKGVSYHSTTTGTPVRAPKPRTSSCLTSPSSTAHLCRSSSTTQRSSNPSLSHPSESYSPSTPAAACSKVVRVNPSRCSSPSTPPRLTAPEPKIRLLRTKSSTSTKAPKPSTASPGTLKPTTTMQETTNRDHHFQTTMETPHRPRHDPRRPTTRHRPVTGHHR